MELYLFDRTEKIIRFEDLSILKDENKINGTAYLSMSENEVFVFQLAVVSHKDDCINEIKASGNLDITCINTDAVDKWGNERKLTVPLKANTIQPLFFTVKAEKKGKRQEQCTITINTDSESHSFNAVFKVLTSPVTNNGYDDLWRLSRIEWLNSRLCQDEKIIKPYTTPELKNGRQAVIGREIETGGYGLPSQVYSKFSESVELEDTVQKTLFAKPSQFLIGDMPIPNGETQTTAYPNRIESVTESVCDDYSAKISSVLRYEGLLEYSVEITPKRDFTVNDAGLRFFIGRDCSSLMHGLGHRASTAENLSFKWNVDKQQDCIYIGCVNCGMRLKLKTENYRRPLVNIFYKNLPLVVPTETWDNNGKGGINVRVKEEFTEISAYTGEFSFKENETRKFIFEIHITPLKPIDYKKAFTVRYCHNNRLKDENKEIKIAEKNKLTHIIFHQGNMMMPYINYPFYETDRLKKAVENAKDKGIGVKLYYTEREHSNHMAETFVYKALGDEIILRKKGVGHSWQKEMPQWLAENFGEDIIPGWYVKYKHGKYKGQHDFSFIVKPDTRLDNYYIEGLNWLVDNMGIKGIYIDDTSLDRTTLERAKKVLGKTDGLIDMHMWNHEDDRSGDVSCMNLYTEIIPFLDSVWLGEGFPYKKYTPEYMLAEVSGIPYGVTGQMLEGGGDFYAGMLYGMNNRFGWGHTSAVDMYKVWDDFGITESRMLGYWHSENPVSTDNKNVLATVYLKKDEALLCFYNFADKSEKFSINIVNELLGFSVSEAREIKFGSSRRKRLNLNKEFKLGARKGIIINLKG
ncbi:MAG: glycoside hydrolase domain-containing protein [Eubacterium sp.]